jgi:chromosome partitioning protein
MRKIAVLNQKGGVGKTTTVVNTAAALAAAGLKVVVVDLDPQAHLTIHLGSEPETVQSGSYAVLNQAEGFEEAALLVRPNLWLLPSNINLVGAENELVSVVGRETILREAIAPVEEKFDYLIIDCPPSLGLLTLNALAAVEEILIPLQPHFLALQGFGKLLQTVELVNRRINPILRVKGVLLCMFDSRASLPKEVKADIERFLDKARGTNCAWAQAQILPVCIRRNIKLAEAPSYGKTIFEYEQNCHGAQDYEEVAAFIHGQELPTHDKRAPAAAAQETDEQDVEMSDQTQDQSILVETQPESSTPAPEPPDQEPSKDVEGSKPHVPFEIRTVAKPDSRDVSSEVTPPVIERDAPESWSRE